MTDPKSHLIRLPAAEVHEQIMSELEHQTRAGGVGFTGKTTPVNESMYLDVPMSEKVTAIVPNIDPEDIAAFQSALAKVLHNRTSADACSMFARCARSRNSDRTTPSETIT